MKKYCKCGSLIIKGMCSNKNCNTSELELDLLDMQKRINNYCVNDIIKKKIKKFDGFIPMIPKYNGLLNTLDDENSELIGVELRALKAFNIPLNISIASKYSDNDDEYYDEILFLKITAPTFKEARGKINKIMPYLIKLEVYTPSENRGYEVYFGSYNDSKWEMLSNYNVEIEEINKALFQIYSGMSLQYSLSKNWSIYSKDENDIIGMRVMIGKNKVKEIFKLRDIEDGKQRRTALRHIVGQHTRIINDSEIDISSYFRGVTEFMCDGLKYKLIPSLKDLRIVEKEKLEKKKNKVYKSKI